MNILFVCKALPYAYQGGIQTHVWELGKALLRSGINVSMLTAGSYKRGNKTFELDGIIIHEIPTLPKRFIPFIPTIGAELSFNLGVNKWLKKHHRNYDIIHLQARSGYFYPGSKIQISTPCITTIHRLMNVEGKWGQFEFKYLLDYKIYKYFALKYERKGILKSDAVIAISKEVVKEVQEFEPNYNPQKLHLIYNGIVTELPPNDSPLPKDNNQLVFLGRLVEIKGLIPLIESMPLTHPRIKLLIIGKGNLKPQLEAKIKTLQLEERVSFTGAIPTAEVFRHIKASYAIILPSFHETQGIVLMEGNICGLPVLGSNVPGINEMIIQGQNGLLFPQGNAKRMAEAINYLFDHPQEAKAMGEWGKTYVKRNFNWDLIAEKTVHLYKSIIKSQSKAPSVKRFKTGQS